MPNDIILETHSLCFSYPDGTEALTDISIQIPRGKTIAILGGNGAGKSTLFLHLNGILKPKSGSIAFDTSPISYSKKGIYALRQNIGIVFQDPEHQLFSASVYQDVSFGVMNLGLSESESRARIEHAILHTGIDSIRHRPTHSLSYGQKKRVALAGILAMKPQILILDEPTAGLDPSGISEIMSLIQSLQNDLGISIILSTHDIDLVPLYCDYIYLLDNGKIVSKGTPDEIFSQPTKLREVHLRLPRIGHLIELLKTKDHFLIEGCPTTISKARLALCKLLK